MLAIAWVEAWDDIEIDDSSVVGGEDSVSLEVYCCCISFLSTNVLPLFMAEYIGSSFSCRDRRRGIPTIPFLIGACKKSP